MSRSRKKNPVVGIASSSSSGMRRCKKAANRKVRKKDDVAGGNAYRKIDERYTWPDDGKHWCDNPKAYRK